MKVETSGLPAGPIQNFANALNTYLTRLRSVPCEAVPNIAALPKAAANANRIFIVDDIGAGVTGIAVSRNGVWKTGALT